MTYPTHYGDSRCPTSAARLCHIRVSRLTRIQMRRFRRRRFLRRTRAPHVVARVGAGATFVHVIKLERAPTRDGV